MAKAASVRKVRYNVAVHFILRDYRPGDFGALWRIDQKCFAAGIAYSQRELGAYIRRRGAFTLVAQGLVPSQSEGDDFNGILGFIVAETGRRGLAHIISIDVVPHGRRLGVGSELLQAVEDRLRSSRFQNVVLETAVDNAAALAFYKRHHYSVVKVIPRYYPNGVDAFLMDKKLLNAEAARRQP